MFGSLWTRLQYTIGIGVHYWKMERRAGQWLCYQGYLSDLSKTFDFIPHDLIIVKMVAYGLNFNDLTLMLKTHSADKAQNLPSLPLKMITPPSWNSTFWYWKICKAPFFSNPLQSDHFTLPPIPHHILFSLIQYFLSSRNPALYFQNYY